MCNNHSTPKKLPTCRDCANFNGMNPSFVEGAPLAWCNYGGETRACTPWEPAEKKVCYRSQE